MKGEELGPIPDDDVTTALARLVADLKSELLGVADVELDTGEGIDAVTVTPRRDGAVEVFWMHCSADLQVSVDNVPGWELPRTLDAVRQVEAVVRAAVAGRVRIGRALGFARYEVLLDDGTVLESEYQNPWSVLLDMPWGRRLKPSRAPAYAEPTGR